MIKRNGWVTPEVPAPPTHPPGWRLEQLRRCNAGRAMTPRLVLGRLRTGGLLADDRPESPRELLEIRPRVPNAAEAPKQRPKDTASVPAKATVGGASPQPLRATPRPPMQPIRQPRRAAAAGGTLELTSAALGTVVTKSTAAPEVPGLRTPAYGNEPVADAAADAGTPPPDLADPTEDLRRALSALQHHRAASVAEWLEADGPAAAGFESEGDVSASAMAFLRATLNAKLDRYWLHRAQEVAAAKRPQAAGANDPEDEDDDAALALSPMRRRQQQQAARLRRQQDNRRGLPAVMDEAGAGLADATAAARAANTTLRLRERLQTVLRPGLAEKPPRPAPYEAAAATTRARLAAFPQQHTRASSARRARPSSASHTSSQQHEVISAGGQAAAAADKVPATATDEHRVSAVQAEFRRLRDAAAVDPRGMRFASVFKMPSARRVTAAGARHRKDMDVWADPLVAEAVAAIERADRDAAARAAAQTPPAVSIAPDP